jgi:hypothetical protein
MISRHQFDTKQTPKVTRQKQKKRGWIVATIAACLVDSTPSDKRGDEPSYLCGHLLPFGGSIIRQSFLKTTAVLRSDSHFLNLSHA